MDELDYNLYTIAELRYKEKYNNMDDIFPADWYSSYNYKLKTEIIAEAIKKNIPIEETNLYQDCFGEGIKEREKNY